MDNTNYSEDSNRHAIFPEQEEEPLPEEYCARKDCRKPIYKDEPRYRYSSDGEHTFCDECGTIMNLQC